MSLSRENEIAHKAIGYAIEVHRNMGPGLGRAVYLRCLEHEIQGAGLGFQKEVSVNLKYKSLPLENACTIDFILENAVLILLDSSETIADSRIHSMVRILQEKNMKLGLIINFNYALMKNGIRRVTNHKMLESGAAQDGKTE